MLNMAKTHPIGFRVQPEIKAALDRAASDDRRSLSSKIEIILTDWCQAHGYGVEQAAEEQGR
jgi:hypothetical protein